MNCYFCKRETTPGPEEYYPRIECKYCQETYGLGEVITLDHSDGMYAYIYNESYYPGSNSTICARVDVNQNITEVNQYWRGTICTFQGSTITPANFKQKLSTILTFH